MHSPEAGPVFGVPLIQTLPIGIHGGMVQQMPSRLDLITAHKASERVVCGYEVLLSHYRDKCRKVAELESQAARDAKRIAELEGLVTAHVAFIQAYDLHAVRQCVDR